MPGLVAFKRRWSVGSDDFVVAGASLAVFHCICTIILICVLCLINFSSSEKCVLELWIFNIVYLSITILSLVLEIVMSCISLKGSILNTEPRIAVKYILYVKLAVLIVEIGIHSYGVYWICVNYDSCPVEYGKTIFLVLIVLNWFTVVSIFFHIWCAYDPVGRKWVKMKEYQLKESESKYQYKRSSTKRNWRQRKVIRAYQDSWDQRCRLLFCCMRATESNRNSFRDVARLLSEYFRDMDVVPSDIIAGIILLRTYQKIERKSVIEQRKNDTYQFLSGVPVTSNTKFLSLQDDGTDVDLFQRVLRYVYFAVRAYGWPMYVMTNRMGLCRLCSKTGCCCFFTRRSEADIVKDNCCHLNGIALETLSELGNIEIIYATFHVDVGQTPFFIALDYDKEKIVISIRGTLSIQDILTDLDAGAEHIPVDPIRDDWLGHKGMVSGSQYIYDTLKHEGLLEQAHKFRPSMGTENFGLVIVGHSLGAGIASILGILLQNEYPDLTCYCYSPPGGLLSMAAMEYTKAFTVSVVLGKDVVPRLGLSQMYTLKADLKNALKRSVDPKWKIISCGMLCCCCAIEPTSATELSTADQAMSDYIHQKRLTRGVSGIYPPESSTGSCTDQPMFPPGRVIHVVRHHISKDEKALSKNEPVFQAIWAENTDFDEVLISPVMIQDHMPDQLLTALNKVVRNFGPRKPRRTSELQTKLDDIPEHPETPKRVYMETSFATFPYTTVRTNSTCESDQSNERASSKGNLDSASSYDAASNPFDRNKNIALLRKSPSIFSKLPGRAPLAFPESLSDTSSTSSFTNLENMCSPWKRSPSILKAPRMMRRTPKIIGNLSTCTDDARNLKTFEKMSQWENSNSNSNLSFSSGSNDHEHYVDVNQCLWQRDDVAKDDVDDVKTPSLAEELLEEILEFADCADFFKSGCPSSSNKQPSEGASSSRLPTSHSSGILLSPHTLQNDPDVISNYAIDLTLEQEHRSLIAQQNLQAPILKVSQSDVCNGSNTPPCSTKTVTFSPDVISDDEKMLFLKANQERSFSRPRTLRLPNFLSLNLFRKPKQSCAAPKIVNISTIYPYEKRKKDIDSFCMKNDD